MENRSDEFNIGIDLGTSTCSVSVFANDRIQTIPIDSGSKVMPSYVHLGESFNTLGRVAKQRQPKEPKQVIYGMKRMVGCLYSDKEFQKDMKHYPFTVKRSEIDGILIKNHANNTYTTPIELSASLIYHAVQEASEYLDGTIKDAVITVPAYFNNVQRNDTINAGIIAGLENVHLISEPTAAAVSYGIINPSKRELVLVFDLGGGSVDVSIIAIVNKEYTVMGCSGDSHFGGEDITNVLTKDIAAEFNAAHNVCIEESEYDYLLLRENVEQAKIALSSVTSYDIDIENLMGFDFHRTVTRSYLESMNYGFFNKCMEMIDATLEKSIQKKEDITRVLLVGGSSMIPFIRERITSMFGSEKIWASANSNDIVSRGAAVVAGISRDVTEKTFDFKTSMYSTTMNCGNSQNLTVNDITPMNLGIRVSDGTLSPIIPAQLNIPCTMCKKYQPHRENQTSMRFKIYQGNDPVAENCKLISEVVLTLDQPGKITDCIVEVEFSLDSNSTLYVKATETKSGKQYEHVVDMGTQVLSRDSVYEMRSLLHESMMFSKQVEKMEIAKLNFQRSIMQSEAQLNERDGEEKERLQKAIEQAKLWSEEHLQASAEEFKIQDDILRSSFYH